MIRPTERWNETTLRTVGFVLVGIATSGVIANILLSASLDDIGNSAEQIFLLVPFIFVLVWLFRAVPRNTAVWALAWAAVLGGLGDTAATVTLWRTGFTTGEFESGSVAGSPADLDQLSLVGLNFAAWSWLGIFILSVHFVLLFPSGVVSSRRWRLVLRAATGVLVLGVLTTSLALAPWVETPFSELFDQDTSWGAGTASMLLIIASVASIINLVLRFRKSAGEERLQYRWVTTAFAFWLVTLVAFGFFPGNTVYDVIYIIALASIPVSIGIAITKYRLYDIDVVISRTLVYGTLAAFIGAVYVGVVVGLSNLFDTGDGSDVWLGIAATVVVAISFQPLRRRLEKAANRLVYGRRATPYEVLSTFSQRVAGVDPGVMTQIAEALVEGTTAESAAVWIRRGKDLQLIAYWPSDVSVPRRVSSGDMSMFSRLADIVHDGQELGAVTVSWGSGQTFSAADSELHDRVAAGLGLALRNLMLTEDLRFHLDELRDSRRRIVAVQDRTRHQLERDLHDGAQQRLVSLKIKLGIAQAMAAKGGFDETRVDLGTLVEQTDVTIDAVRDFARGIYPPLLEAEGLEPALVARTRSLPIPVTVDAAEVSRYPREVEATVYFCVLEAVQNAVKHSEAGSISVTVTETGGTITFVVSDDGTGFDADGSAVGHGLQNMEDRLDAIGGTMGVESSTQGTSVTGRIPIEVGVPA